jgi:hypothetical protein
MLPSAFAPLAYFAVCLIIAEGAENAKEEVTGRRPPCVSVWGLFAHAEARRVAAVRYYVKFKER